MDRQKFADTFFSPTCVVSVERDDDGGYGCDDSGDNSNDDNGRIFHVNLFLSAFANFVTRIDNRPSDGYFNDEFAICRVAAARRSSSWHDNEADETTRERNNGRRNDVAREVDATDNAHCADDGACDEGRDAEAQVEPGERTCDDDRACEVSARH